MLERALSYPKLRRRVSSEDAAAAVEWLAERPDIRTIAMRSIDRVMKAIGPLPLDDAVDLTIEQVEDLVVVRIVPLPDASAAEGERLALARASSGGTGVDRRHQPRTTTVRGGSAAQQLLESWA